MEELEDYSHLVPDPDEEIPETLEEEELEPEQPLEVLARCQASSGVAQLDELKAQVVRWIQGHEKGESLEAPWRALDAELAARAHYFQDGLRFQEWTEEFVETGRSCFEFFEWAAEQMQSLRASLANDDSLAAAYAVEQLQAVFGELEVAYQRLRQLTSGPVLSAYPQVAELARVGHLVLAERLPAEAFSERLQVFADLQGRLFGALSSQATSRRERQLIEQSAVRLQQAQELQAQAFEDLGRFLDEPQEQFLEHGLARLEEAAETLESLRQQLEGLAQEEEQVPCPFCSTPNPARHRYCSQCQARLPEMVEVPEGVFDDRAAPVGANFERLAAAVGQALSGQLSPKELAEVLDWFEGLHRIAQRQLQGLPRPPARTPAAELEIYQEARDRVESALGRVDEGLDLLRGWLDQPESGQRLSDGLERVLEGAQQWCELEALLERVSSLHEGKLD